MAGRSSVGSSTLVAPASVRCCGHWQGRYTGELRAMAKRDPNTSLSRLLTESRWTHRQFARAVNRVGTETGTPLRSDESAVSHWLGGTVPRRPVRSCILEALSCRLGRPVTHADAGLPVPRDHSVTSRDTVEGLIDLGRQDMDPSRRGVLGAGLFSVALTIPGWPDVIGRAEAVQSGRASRIGDNEVNMVVAMTERVSELDDQFGGRHARPMAASFMVNTVAARLHGRGRGTARARAALLREGAGTGRRGRGPPDQGRRTGRRGCRCLAESGATHARLPRRPAGPRLRSDWRPHDRTAVHP